MGGCGVAENRLTLKKSVDEIIAMGQSDPGKAHMMQDILLWHLLIGFLREDHMNLAEIQRLKDDDFSRWYE